MVLAENNNLENFDPENQLFKELDKGIDSMENNCTVPHDKAMQIIRNKLKSAKYSIDITEKMLLIMRVYI